MPPTSKTPKQPVTAQLNMSVGLVFNICSFLNWQRYAYAFLCQLLEMLSLRCVDETDAHVRLSASSCWIAASSDVEHFSNYRTNMF